MVLVGTDMAFETGKVVKGEVPVIPAPETVVERPYITPGGEDGAILTRSPDARLIRRNLDGSLRGVDRGAAAGSRTRCPAARR